MKRLMQLMLAVILVVVTAFTFHMDTASAQSVAAPLPSSCTIGQPCEQPTRCDISPGKRCVIPNAGQLVNITVENLSSSVGAELSIVYGGGSPTSIKIAGGGTYARTISPNGGDVIIYNTGLQNCTIRVTLQVLFKSSVPGE